MHDWSCHGNKSYRVCIRHAFLEESMKKAFEEKDIQVPETFTHHALVGNCYYCMKTGFVGMRCDCNTGGTPRYISLLNGQQLNGNDETTQEPPEPLKICVFYHSVTPPHYFLYGTAYYMRSNGYTIGRGFVPGWDKDFANPTIPWTLPISKTDEFVDQHEEWITIQAIMGKVFSGRKRYYQGLFQG